MPTTQPVNRRTFLVATTALSASVATSALAQDSGGAGQGRGQNDTLVKDYPKPPFPDQKQDWPGLAKDMQPVPDHGEKTYKGSAKLKGRKALLTGGDSGIGRAAAIAFAREGADVAINYLPDEQPDADEVLQLIKDAGQKAIGIPGDIRDEGFCKNLVSKANDELGGLDILVNDAGRQHSVQHIRDLTTELFDWTLKTNLYAMFWITQAALEVMPDGAAIINLASVEAYDPDENLVDYALTKAGIVNFTKSMAKQLGGRKIRVNAIAPGPIWTPLQVSGGTTDVKLVGFGADTPLGRPGQPAELAPAFVNLAAAESSYTTGQVYGVAGGRGNP
jgi:NAD(P)-dependent dehydrogenase (short-subunit alcohol dehydrogenase family)